MSLVVTLFSTSTVQGASDTITKTGLTGIAVGTPIAVAVEYADNGDTGTQAISNNNTAVTWSQVLATNTGSNVRVVLYTGTVPAGTVLTSISVQSLTGNSLVGSKILYVFVPTGAHATNPFPAGNLFLIPSGTGSQAQSLTPTSPGSYLIMVLGDWQAKDPAGTDDMGPGSLCSLAEAAQWQNGQLTGVVIYPTAVPRPDTTAFVLREADTGLTTTIGVAFEIQGAPSASDDGESGARQGGWNPSRRPNKRKRFRATPQAPTLNDANLPDVVDESVSASRSRFGWSPMRRPMMRRTLRASTEDTQIASGSNQLVTPGIATITLTTFAPDVLTPVVVTPGVASLVLTTFAPAVLTPVVVTPGAAALVLTTFAPSVSTTNGLTLVPGTAALTLTLFAPTVTATANQVVVPGVATLTLTTFAPVVTVSGGQTVTPGVASLLLTTFAPDVLTPVTVTPGKLSLVLTTFAPAVLLPILVTPPTRALTLSTFAPVLTATAHQVAIPGTAVLTLTTFAPIIGAGLPLETLLTFTVSMSQVVQSVCRVSPSIGNDVTVGRSIELIHRI